MMKKLLALISFFTLCVAVNAQQDLLLSQQFFSRINKNPAGVGNISDLDIFFLGRCQWLDVKDSPKSGVLNAQTFIEKYNSGVGFTCSYDNLGVAKSMLNPKLVYAYNLKLNDDMLLSFGLSAGIQYGYFDASDYELEDETERNDGDFPMEKETKFSPDFDFGAEFSTPNLLLGFSITHIVANGSTSLISGRHFYGYARYIFPLNETFDLAPALVYMNHGKTNVFELNVVAFYNRLFWGGLTYHPDINDGFGTNPVGVTLGVEYNRFRFGYTFDYNFGAVADYSGSAHEIMLSFNFPNKNKKEVFERFE